MANAHTHRFWLDRLYESLHPPWHVLGDITMLLANDNFSRAALKIVRIWVEGFAYALDYYPQKAFLTELLRVTDFGLSLDPHAAHTYLHQGKYRTTKIPREYIRKGDGYIVKELIETAEGHVPWSLNAGMLCISYVFPCSPKYQRADGYPSHSSDILLSTVCLSTLQHYVIW